MDEYIYYTLNRIKMEINEEYGFEGDITRINYGSCGSSRKVCCSCNILKLLI